MISFDSDLKIFDSITKNIQGDSCVAGVKGITFINNSLATLKQVGGHDNGVAVITPEGKVVAIECERLDKIKHSNGVPTTYSDALILNRGEFPPPSGVQLAFAYCGSSIKEEIGIIGKHLSTPFAHDIMFAQFSKDIKEITIRHHDSHASGAYWSSEFDECSILVVDAFGSYCNKLNCKEEVSIYIAENNKISCIDRFGSGLGGIGFLYFCVSRALGLTEGKLMGLAGYYSGNERSSFLKTYNNSCGISLNIKKWPKCDNFDFEALRSQLGISTKISSKDVIREDYIRAAGMVQNEIEDAMVTLAKRLRKLSQMKMLAISGGVGLNITANTRIMQEAGYNNVHIQPSCSDSGIALGNALFLHNYVLRRPEVRVISPFLGRSYHISEWIHTIKALYPELNISILNKETTIMNIAKALVGGKVVGFYQGECEIGPRALGNRSILASPCNVKTRDHLNSIKGRELWRPLAPLILQESVKHYFDIDHSSPYMLFSFKATNFAKKRIPACIHVDGTARIQTVTKNDRSILYDLLKTFESMTGIPCLINTSFNIAGQPIVETPLDAVQCFWRIKLDCLFIDGVWIVKNGKCDV